ncbi:MAG: VOC family protein [Proteobacteria bacterium]|nr:VOC family protein [Pseudomonadota bacterium]
MQHNPIGWTEIYVQDMARARKFYETVLAIKLEEHPVPPDMQMEMVFFPAQMELPGSGGALVKMEGVPSGMGGTLAYFVCADCGVESGRVEAAGGKIFKPKFSIGEYGNCALCHDSEGNLFGLHSMK